MSIQAGTSSNKMQCNFEINMIIQITVQVKFQSITQTTVIHMNVVYKLGIDYGFGQNVVYCSKFLNRRRLLGKIVVYVLFILTLLGSACLITRSFFFSLPCAFFFPTSSLSHFPPMFFHLLHCLLFSFHFQGFSTRVFLLCFD